MLFPEFLIQLLLVENYISNTFLGDVDVSGQREPWVLRRKYCHCIELEGLLTVNM